MNIGEFFVKLGVNADTDKLQTFDDKLNNLQKSVKGIALLGLAVAMERFANATVNSTVAVQNMVNQTGLLASGIRQWQIAAELSDISLTAEQVNSSITSLQQNLTEISLGGGNVTPFQMLGVDVAGKNAFQVMEDLRGAIQGLDNATATNLITQTGLTPQFINVLRMSREEFEKLFSNETILDKEKMKAVIDMGTAFTDLRISLSNLRDILVATVAPALTFVLNIFDNILEGVNMLLNKFSILGDLIGGYLVTAFATLMAKISPLTTILAGFLLIIEDFAVFAQGGDSAIGRLLDGIEKLGEALIKFVAEPFDIAIKKFEELKSKLSGGILGEGGGIASPDSPLFSPLSSPSASPFTKSIVSTIQNTFNINSNADAGSIADNVQDVQQRELNNTLESLDNATAN